MNDSVKLIVTELEKKISSFDNATLLSQDYKKGYSIIYNILDNVMVTSPERVTVQDIVRLTPNEVENILLTVGMDREEVRRIVLNFNPNKLLYEGNTHSALRKKEINDFFDKIRREIIKYINSYKGIDTNTNNKLNDQRKMCEKIIRIFTIPNNLEVFEPNMINEIDSFLIENGISATDRANALGYLNEIIISTSNIVSETPEEIDIRVKVNNLEKRYLFNNKEYLNLVSDYVDNESIDIDSIPSIAKDICRTTGLKYEKMLNTLIAYIAGGLYSNYIANKSDELLNNIKLVLKFTVKDKDELLNECRKLVEENKELYMEAVKNNEPIDSYVDEIVSSIASHYNISYDEAIDKKCLPFIKMLSKLLERMNNLEPDTNEYQEGLNNINVLIGMFNEQQSRKHGIVKNK